jgi:hypothetical protein
MMRKPKILNLSTPTLRNQRTLIWLQNQSSTIDWSKWDGIITSLDAFKNWSETKSKIVIRLSHLIVINFKQIYT